MHDTISNLTGWIFIIWKKPLAQGDRIQIDKNVGDVIDITPLYFTMLEVGGERIGGEQSTGRIIHIPNGKLLRNEIINYNEGFDYIWHEISIVITFESDWQLTKNILEGEINAIAGHYPEAARKAMRKASRKLAIKQGKLTPIIYTNAIEYGVALTVRFIVSPRQIRGVESRIWETILMRFQAEKSIQLAYPTTRFYQSGE
jgi:small-conductance mechanosensitive channel